ncbi:hypothetical protein OPQ81_011537 [Rhizoctonia solani]|nr:hypothetical protein OPQ81_011537 [Rhizoctonia solani]
MDSYDSPPHKSHRIGAPVNQQMSIPTSMLPSAPLGYAISSIMYGRTKKFHQRPYRDMLSMVRVAPTSTPCPSTQQKETCWPRLVAPLMRPLMASLGTSGTHRRSVGIKGIKECHKDLAGCSNLANADFNMIGLGQDTHLAVVSAQRNMPHSCL